MSGFMRRLVLLLLIAAIAAPVLSACGRKSELESPPGEEQQYPRRYPSQ